ncbi:hypothetical protein [Deinococcus arcticus]|uniref:DUF11 domain-containing protein n=1 Tax=Deinococcus arcticus TaxID=2136176 RepID=A0A2T3WBK4_9DEIO|nr:hypothetical protein [Deinococcus arcticus]PTA69290.1 hypothetical protein C8263_02850 [Deinococcus arcticus]
MKHNLFSAVALLCGLSLAAAQAVPSPLKLTASTSVVTQTTQNGKTVETLTDASKTAVVPGTLLDMAQTWQSVTRSDLRNMSLNMRVDPATTFRSAACNVSGVTTLFSADGGKTFGPAPLKKTVTVTENGRQVQRQVEVKPSEYTNVRWQLPLIKAGSEGRCALRVVVK